MWWKCFQLVANHSAVFSAIVETSNRLFEAALLMKEFNLWLYDVNCLGRQSRYIKPG